MKVGEKYTRKVIQEDGTIVIKEYEVIEVKENGVIISKEIKQ